MTRVRGYRKERPRISRFEADRCLFDVIRHVLRHPRALLPGAPRGIINSARDWLAYLQSQVPVDIRRGPSAAVWEVDPCALVSLPPPRSVEKTPFAQAQRLFPVPATALYFLRGARVIGSDALVISADNRVFAEFTYVDEPGGVDRHSIFRRRRFPKPKALPGWYATLSYPSAFSYYHWIVESLPRLRLLEPHLHALDGVFVPANLTGSMKESLYALGVRPDQLVPMDISSHYAPSHLLVPQYCAGLDVPRWVPEYLRMRVLGEEVRNMEGRGRIYLSRARTGRRRVLNECDLLPVLERYGFQIVHSQELSFADQARRFAEAELIVGPSGAALANVVFARQGARLVVLQPHASFGPHCFYSLAAAGDVGYWDLPGTPVAPLDGAVEHADFVIEPVALEQIINLALQSTDTPVPVLKAGA